MALFKSGKLKEAVEAFKQAIRIKPDYPEAYYNLGIAYSQMNMYQEALQALKQSIRLNPDIPKVHFRLGVIYSTQDTASALKEYEILKNLDRLMQWYCTKSWRSGKILFLKLRFQLRMGQKRHLKRQKQQMLLPRKYQRLLFRSTSERGSSFNNIRWLRQKPCFFRQA